MEKCGLFIDGDWISQGREMRDIINPSTEKPIGQYAVAKDTDIAAAVDASVKGFKIWSRTPAAERGDVMRKAAALLLERSAEIGRKITLEQGKPLGSASFEPSFGASEINWYAEEAVRAYGRIVPAREPGQRNLVMKQPIGPVLLIAPWNYPLASPCVKIAGALAAGCSVIIKPSEETPLGCAELVQAYADAGLPDGVLNMLTGNPDMIARGVLGSPEVRKVSFTGSTAVGRHIMSLVTENLQAPTMELGGHAPVVVTGDVDVNAVADALVAKKLQNGGQVCLSPSRFFIHSSIYDAFVERFAEGMAAQIVGDGFDDGSTMGPLINAARRDAMERLIDDAVSKGATLVTGGKRIGDSGYFFEPTVLSHVSDDALIMHEEPFGPVAPFQPWDELDEVIARANSVPYGLIAYAFAHDRVEMERLATELEAGIVTINRTNAVYPETPMGGVKWSGFGKELGAEGIDAYQITKFVSENNPLTADAEIVKRG